MKYDLGLEIKVDWSRECSNLQECVCVCVAAGCITLGHDGKISFTNQKLFLQREIKVISFKFKESLEGTRESVHD